MFRILIVDDEPEVVRALRRLLRREGYTVGCAPSGADALAMLGTFDPHLVLTDFRMPAMTGAELLRTVAQRSPRTVGVLLSGNADLATSSKDRDTVVLDKPWEDDVLCARLRELLEKPSAPGSANHADAR